MNTPVGFVGLGLMGHAMAGRLLAQGRKIVVYNRTRDKAQSLLDAGATWCESPAAVARRASIVLSMVSDSAALESVSTGPDGILNGAREDLLHVDHSTVAPSTTHKLGEAYQTRGRTFMHCPVLGSVSQAESGSLLLFAGGPDDAYTRVEPLLQILGSQIWRFSTPPQASHTKLMCNLFIAGMVTTLGQALAYARKANVDPSLLLQIISHSALNAPTYQTKGASILEGNFSPRFYLQHMLKDVTLMLDAAGSVGARLPAIEITRSLLQRAVNEGLGKEDYSAVVKILLEDAGIAT